MQATQPSRGMRDFLPADIRKRDHVIGVIRDVYERFGFEPLETPAVENLDTLMGKYGEEGNQLIYKILKRGEKLREAIEGGGELADLALRYDLTVPLARVVANHRNVIPKFFKRYQIQPVWRADRPARGRYREFYQCDADVIGSTSLIVEAELIAAVNQILERLGFDDHIIRINHRDILADLVAASGIPQEMGSGVMTTLDKLDKIGPSGVSSELLAAGIDANAVERFLQEVTANASPSDVPQLAPLYALLTNTDCASRLRVDKSLARGLSYYTGTIIEINVPDLASSLGGGGRYDGLIGMFQKEQVAACGFSLGLERIIVVMEERGMFPTEVAEARPADVLVTVWSAETVAESLAVASEFRSNGFRATVYPEPDKLGKQLKYADAIGVPFVCIVGDDEIAQGKARVKDMRTGDERLVDRKDLGAILTKG